MKIESVTHQMFIAGRRVEAADGKRFTRLSPAHDVPVGSYPEAGEADAHAAVAAARLAFDEGPWPRTSGAEREAVLRRTAALLRENTERLALMETLESGKPISQARSEIGWAAGIWDYAAGLARQLHGDTYNQLGASMLGLVLREPIGVAALITPWNFPLLIISQKLPFALAAGCTTVVKPSELTPGTTLVLAELLQQAGLPDGVVNVITGFGNPAGESLARHDDVDLISFTGSTAVGKKIVAAAAGNLKKVSLELGGKNPQIIFPDADLEAALDAVLFGVFFNMGECCNSGSRILLHRDIAEDFTARLIERARTVAVGDPLDEKTKVGAIIDERQFLKISTYLEAGRTAGATVRLGGGRLSSAAGRFIEPTIFTGVTPDMTIACEEIFGPVLSILEFDSPAEALAIANTSLYGLSASVWTRDIDTAISLSRDIRAGTVWINTFMDGSPELPFGGYKQSGLGRELGRASVEEYTETKTVQVHLGPRTGWWHTPPAAG